jgi:hypothetical protein
MVIRKFSLRIWMKLAAIVLALTCPLVLTMYFFVSESNLNISSAQQELRGDDYLRLTSQLLVHVELHRTAVRQNDTAQESRT